MLKNFFTNTKSRWNIKYFFKNNNKNTPKAINYHGGLSSTYLMSLSLSHEVHSMRLQLPHDKQTFFLMSSYSSKSYLSKSNLLPLRL